MACELMFFNLALIDFQRLTFGFLYCRVIRGCPDCPSAASRYMLTWTQSGCLKIAKWPTPIIGLFDCVSVHTWTPMVRPCKLRWLQYINLLRWLLCIPWSRGYVMKWDTRVCYYKITLIISRSFVLKTIVSEFRWITISVIVVNYYRKW